MWGHVWYTECLDNSGTPNECRSLLKYRYGSSPFYNAATWWQWLLCTIMHPSTLPELCMNGVRSTNSWRDYHYSRHIPTPCGVLAMFCQSFDLDKQWTNLIVGSGPNKMSRPWKLRHIQSESLETHNLLWQENKRVWNINYKPPKLNSSWKTTRQQHLLL